jgi:hypothetical protein
MDDGQRAQEEIIIRMKMKNSYGLQPAGYGGTYLPSAIPYFTEDPRIGE